MSSIPGQIRNIQQSVQYRDIVKQASDIIVYIDGLDYMINPYLGDEGVVVPINDYTTAWQSSYDLDTTVPSGSLTLTVAAQDDHLFRLPGGNRLINTMSDIRVFAKGYYLSPRGNTLYHQIFKGYISNVTHAPTAEMTTITLSCYGSLGILERMQIEQSPSTMSSSPMEITAFSSTTWNLNPYETIAWVFLYSSMIDGFETYSIKQAVMNKNNPYYEAVQEQYVAKWQALLYDLARDVHIFGTPSVNHVIDAISKNIKQYDGESQRHSKEALGDLNRRVGKKDEVEQVLDNQDYYKQIRGYMPDFGIGSIQLLNGRVSNRLERLRYMVSLIGFEAYQDIDGGIVIKPPLYNLDVMNLDNDGKDSSQIDPSLVDLTVQNNPFVVYPNEIITPEIETEDEGGVRLTRTTARGSYLPGWQWNASKEMLATAEDIDLQKLAQFGLRTEPPKEAHWFKDSDPKALYAFAASEMARANRGFRTYSVTIPLRPELKLGIPMYLPHMDIYGYIKNVSMSWTRGSTAQTTVTLDTIRRRPLIPVSQTVETPGSVPQKKVFMTPQKNLVMKWTKVEESPASGTTPTSSKADLVGNLASLPLPQQLVIGDAVKVIEARRQSSTNFGVNSDWVSHCWRVQEDSDHTFDHQRDLDTSYFADLQTQRPHTDDKGYEVVGPFPWGRWKSLKSAITDFTISDALGAGGAANDNPVIQPINSEAAVLSNVDAFLFTGDTAASSDTTLDFANKLVQQAAYINNYKIFELSYTDTTATADTSDTSTAQTGLSSTLSPSVPTNTLRQDPEAELANRSNTLLTGQSVDDDFLKSILQSVQVDLVPVDSEGGE